LDTRGRIFWGRHFVGWRFALRWRFFIWRIYCASAERHLLRGMERIHRIYGWRHRQ
jgi:hypothetical protein